VSQVNSCIKNSCIKVYTNGIGNIAEPFSLEAYKNSPLFTDVPLSCHTSAADGITSYFEYTAGNTHCTHITGRATSSLDVARLLDKEGLLNIWDSVLCHEQTAGRGQLGRNWHSAPGNIYATVRLPHDSVFDCAYAAVVFCSYLVHTLNEMGCICYLKWPNDIVVYDREGLKKAGGILLEGRNGKLYAGAGLNIGYAPPDSFLRENHALKSGILPLSSNMSLFQLWQLLVMGIKNCYLLEVEQAGFWYSLASRHLAFSGQDILIADHTRNMPITRGYLKGLHPDGSLIIENGGYRRFIHSGSIMLAENRA